MNTSVSAPSNEVLNSWKEIAVYLGRGVRTVQRWETELNLPVRRLHARGHTPVVALRSEIDFWLKQRVTTGAGSFNAAAFSSRLQLESRQLRLEVKQSREELREAVSTLCTNLKKMMATAGSS